MNLKFFLIIDIIFYGSTALTHKPLFLPNLPAGEYRIKTKAYASCESTEHHLLKFNLFLSKKSPTIVESMGNLTFLIPFDNSLSMNVNFAVKGSIGGWIDNAHVYATKKGCDSLKSLMGNSWKNFTRAFNLSSSCPIKPGVYLSSGLNVNDLNNNDFPKHFFYGEYKITTKFTNDLNTILGCNSIITEFVRPWEV